MNSKLEDHINQNLNQVENWFMYHNRIKDKSRPLLSDSFWIFNIGLLAGMTFGFWSWKLPYMDDK